MDEMTRKGYEKLSENDQEIVDSMIYALVMKDAQLIVMGNQIKKQDSLEVAHPSHM